MSYHVPKQLPSPQLSGKPTGATGEARKRRAAATAATLLTLSLAPAVQSADGTLDPSFGAGGLVVFDNPIPGTRSQDLLNAVAIQPDDGKIVVAGRSGSFDPSLPDNPANNLLRENADIVVARFDANGQLDSGFGANGVTTTDLTPDAVDLDVAEGLVLQDDRKVVVAGSSRRINPPGVQPPATRLLAVVRYTENGALDPSFGSGGILITPVPDTRQSFANDAALQSDGKIVVVGGIVTNGGSSEFLLARYNADNGSLDDGGPQDSTPGDRFGPNGFVTTDFVPTGNDFASSVMVLSDGKIVAGGAAGRLPGSPQIGDFALARYNADGSLDTSFGGDGRVTTDFNTAVRLRLDEVTDLAVQPDGKIVAAGTSTQEESFVFALARYNPDGSPDAGFGRLGNGTQTTSFPDGTDGVGNSIAVLPGGKLLAAGARAFGDTQDEAEFALIRYQPNGREDTTFGDDVFGGEDGLEPEGVLDGIKFQSFGPNRIARGSAMALQPDGKFVLVGRFNPNLPNSTPQENDFALARFQSAVIPENITCQGRPATVIGTPGDDILVGTRQDDIIASLDGNDTVIAQRGNDTICAGAGRDLVFGGSGSDRIEGNGGNDQLVGELPFVDRVAGKDVLRGGKGNDRLFGGPGNDLLEGGTGKDAVVGGPGKDELDGGADNDTINGGPGNDVVRGGSGRDTLVGDLPGETGRDRMSGGSGNDVLFGGDANDILSGEGGRDTLLGEGGNDTGNGGTGQNQCLSVEKATSCIIRIAGETPKLPRFFGPSACNVPQCGL